MVICADCGFENSEGFRFCPSCGASLTPTVERRKLVTSVFCDLSGSTALAERVDAESVFELMRSYYEVAREALERHGGVVEKFIGDAVVGMFGVPQANEDDALRACRAALEIQERVANLNRELEAGIGVRIGVNTGEVVAGEATRREMFAVGNVVVLGDSVNVAARLEQAAAPGDALIGEATFALVRDVVIAAPVAPIVAKGKSSPLVAFRLLGLAHRNEQRGASAALIGRGAEVSRLEQEFAAIVAEPQCRLVTIVGEPGVGKSRLAAELVRRIGDRARCALGTCLSYGEGITYWPAAEIVRDLAGIEDDHSAEEARERVPERIAQMLGLTEGSVTSDQIAEAVAGLLEDAASERPLLLVIDDIHWAEPALLEMLLDLSRRIRDASILVICLARPELVERRPGWPITVTLGPLGASEVDELLEGLAAPPAARVRLAQAAGGNPLYAEELVAWVSEGGSLDALPPSLNALLSSRLDRLDLGAREALERGAVEGEVFHRGAVVELTDEPARPAVPRRLDGLTRKDMIRLTAASLAGEAVAYHFKHILVREAAYRATTKKLRARLHEHYADWLEQRVGTRVGEYHEVLGYHLEQAYRYLLELGAADHHAVELATRAGRHLGIAGRRANDRADVRAAANLLGRATKLMPPDSIERLELLHQLTYAVDQSGMMLEAQAIAQELYERATALGNRRLAAHGKSYATPNPFYDNRADPVAAKAAYEELVETFSELGDEAGLAAAQRRLALVYRSQGRFAESIAWLEAAFEHTYACDDISTRRAVAFSLASDLVFGATPVADAIARCEQLHDASGDDPALEAAISRRLSELFAMAGRFEESRALERQARGVLEEAQLESLTWGTLGASARAKILMGDRTGAEHDLIAQWNAYPVEGGKTQRLAIAAAYNLATFYCDEGRWDEAEECLATYRHQALEWPRRLALDARVAAHHGRLAEALTLAQRAVEKQKQSDDLNTNAGMWLALAEVQGAAGNNAEAKDAVARALALYEQKGNVAAAARLRAAPFTSARPS